MGCTESSVELTEEENIIIRNPTREDLQTAIVKLEHFIHNTGNGMIMEYATLEIEFEVMQGADAWAVYQQLKHMLNNS